MNKISLDEKDKIDIYMAEYVSLRAEQMKRIDSQNQAINYLLIVLGFAATAVVASLNKPELMPLLPQVIFWVLLFLPIITAPLAFVFFDHELAIHSVGSHLYHVWYKNTIKPLLNNEHFLKDALAFPELKPAGIHGKLSNARWNLFLVPTGVPIFFLPIYLYLYRGYWWDIVQRQSLSQTLAGILFCLCAYGINIYSLALIIRAISWARTKHNIERHVVIYYKPGTTKEQLDSFNRRLGSREHTVGTPNPIRDSIDERRDFPDHKKHQVQSINFANDIADEQRQEIISLLLESELVVGIELNAIPANIKTPPTKTLSTTDT